MKNEWYKEHLTDGKSSLPFSFTYDGQPSAPLLATWPVKADEERLDAHRTRRTLTWTDPNTGLEVRCVAVDYADFPAVEWTVWFKNTGAGDTPILENIQGLDVQFEREAADPEFVLNGIKGDFESAERIECAAWRMAAPKGRNIPAQGNALGNELRAERGESTHEHKHQMRSGVRRGDDRRGGCRLLNPVQGACPPLDEGGLYRFRQWR